MHKLQEKGIEKVIEFLKSINCQYKVIDTDGKVFTNITENPFVKKRAEPAYPVGAMTSHIRKHADNIKIGDVIKIPVGEFDVPRLSSVASSYFSQKFGNGSCTTHRTNDGVEVLRMY